MCELVCFIVKNGLAPSIVSYADILVVEPPVLVLSKQRNPDRRQCLALKELQSLLECVVDVNASVCTDDESTTRAVDG